MPDTNLMLTLGKVIIAAAWADGAVSNDEINSLKDLLIRLPDLTALQWATLDMYIETPVDAAERVRLVEELKAALRSPEDRALALAALNGLVAADGVVTKEEKRVAEEIRAALNAVDLSLFGQLSRLLKGPVARRAQAAGAPDREARFEDFIKNKVYYEVCRRLDLGAGELHIPEEKLRKLALAGGMMARIARVHRQITEGEFAAIVDALQTHWNVTRAEATFVAQAATDALAADMDALRLAREFVKAVPYEERVQFLDVLFAVATADHIASDDEIEEIRRIARMLLVTHKEFIDAKLKVPRERRES